jgi:hypothetical protein
MHIKEVGAYIFDLGVNTVVREATSLGPEERLASQLIYFICFRSFFLSFLFIVLCLSLQVHPVKDTLSTVFLIKALICQRASRCQLRLERAVLVYRHLLYLLLPHHLLDALLVKLRESVISLDMKRDVLTSPRRRGVHIFL